MLHVPRQIRSGHPLSPSMSSDLPGPSRAGPPVVDKAGASPGCVIPVLLSASDCSASAQLESTTRSVFLLPQLSQCRVARETPRSGDSRRILPPGCLSLSTRDSLSPQPPAVPPTTNTPLYHLRSPKERARAEEMGNMNL